MRNSDTIKKLFSTLDEDKEIVAMQEEYELSKENIEKLKEVLIEKAIELDSKKQILSPEQWREVYMNTVMMITSTDYGSGGMEEYIDVSKGEDVYNLPPKQREILIDESSDLAINKSKPNSKNDFNKYLKEEYGYYDDNSVEDNNFYYDDETNENKNKNF